MSDVNNQSILTPSEKRGYNFFTINTLRFYLCVRVSVCDGCGRGRNEFAVRVHVAVTNLRFVCKTITCASAFTELEIKWP